MHLIVQLCRNNPEIVIFLALALGYLIGRVKIKGFSLGATTGCLLAALILGQINVQVPDLLKAVAFGLFIFAIGYRVGPQFFGGLHKDAIKYVWVSLAVAVAGLVVALILGKILKLDPGMTAGLLGGAMTQSAVIGTAEGAIKHLPVSETLRQTYAGHVAVAYAITYIFGTAGLIVSFKIMPRLLKIDLKDEAVKLARQMSGGSGTEEPPELFSWHRRLDLRAFRVAHPDIFGKKVKDVEALFPGRTSIDKLKRGDQVTDPDPDTALQEGDMIAVVAYHTGMLKGEKLIGPEVDDLSVVDLTGEILDICVTHKDAVGKTLAEISAEHGHGLFLKKMTRVGQELPIHGQTVVHKYDVLTVAGRRKDVERAADYLGFPERPTVTTDLIAVGIGIMLGTLLGLISVPVLGIPITLGVGGGILVSGLVFGWLRAAHPTFGQIPTPAQWIFTDLGLNLFIVCVGLMAGPKAMAALKSSGAAIFFAGVAVTLLPMLTGLFVGLKVFKINPVLLFGALIGAETCTAALNVVKEDADSALPVLGYTLPYAFGNVFLTVWGSVIVNVMHVIT